MGWKKDNSWKRWKADSWKRETSWKNPAYPVLQHLDFSHENYIFAFLNTPKPQGWEKSGYLDDLLKIYLKGRPLALLSFPIDEDGAYVLEAETTYNLSRGRASIEKALRDYAKSMIPLTSYKGDFEMPELVVANEIPIKMINLEAILQHSR